jgi:hypothetical protein
MDETVDKLLHFNQPVDRLIEERHFPVMDILEIIDSGIVGSRMESASCLNAPEAS